MLEAIAKMGFSLSEVFVRENYKQLSFSEEELAKKKVGILGTMFPPFMRKPDFKLSDLTEEEKKGMGSRVPLQASAVLLIVVYDPRQRAPASEGDFLGIMSLGCVMENMWLMASSLGIGLHILSSLAAEPGRARAEAHPGYPRAPEGRLYVPTGVSHRGAGGIPESTPRHRRFHPSQQIRENGSGLRRVSPRGRLPAGRLQNDPPFLDLDPYLALDAE